MPALHIRYGMKNLNEGKVGGKFHIVQVLAIE